MVLRPRKIGKIAVSSAPRWQSLLGWLAGGRILPSKLGPINDGRHIIAALTDYLKIPESEVYGRVFPELSNHNDHYPWFDPIYLRYGAYSVWKIIDLPL